MTFKNITNNKNIKHKQITNKTQTKPISNTNKKNIKHKQMITQTKTNNILHTNKI